MKDKHMSIKKVITIIFILTMLLSTTGIGYLVFSGWISSTEEISESMLEKINKGIYEKINEHLYIPYHINEWNHRIIEKRIVDFEDEIARDKFFVNTLSVHGDEVYSFSLGTNTGEYYGARRNEKNEIEIMRNNESTGGHSWYYKLNKEMTAGELSVKAGEFDPRTRDWYKVVEESRRPSFSPIYRHFIMEDLTISFGWPIFGKTGELEGVLGTHMLLSGISSYLEEAIDEYRGYAIIIERESGALIGNSMGMENFSYLKDGRLNRYNICDIENEAIKVICDNYLKDKQTDFNYEEEDERLYVNIKEVSIEGLDWAIVTAIPQDLYTGGIKFRIKLFTVLTLSILVLSLFIYNLITKKLMKPIDQLLQVSYSLALGDLTQRVKIVRNDEIGAISKSLNRVADRMQSFINNLEDRVDKRTEELKSTNSALEENKNQLQTILDSTVEGIYGLDSQGKCTFCNKSAIKLLGYNNQEELLGEYMHTLIHHSHKDGSLFLPEDCKILRSMNENKVYHVNDEVFWKANNTYFDVEYFAHPHIRRGKVVGTVITFMDITDRKKKEEEIRYLSSHDMLTGLQNKWSFEKSRVKMDIAENLPLSVIYADINGLKLTNDIFGHNAGDELIKKSSEVLTRHCRDYDVVARVGGDEFIMLLPRTSKENTKRIISRIRSGFERDCVVAVKCSISLGTDTKEYDEEFLEDIIISAESAMYKDKAENRRSTNKEIIDTIIGNLHSKHPREKEHSLVVSQLSVQLGQALGLSKEEISKLEKAAYLHDIGKISLNENILQRGNLREDENQKMQQHSIVGFRILSLFDDTMDIAEYVYNHNERWDGKGYPNSLKKEEIPLLSRIISLTEAYERMLNNKDIAKDKRKEKALDIIKAEAGKKFDPHLVEEFLKIHQ